MEWTRSKKSIWLFHRALQPMSVHPTPTNPPPEATPMKTFLAIYTGSPESMEQWKSLDASTREARGAAHDFGIDLDRVHVVSR